MSSLQVLQNKAAKVILNRPLYSSSTEALAVLKWLPLEKRRFQRRCVHVYIVGLVTRLDGEIDYTLMASWLVARLPGGEVTAYRMEDLEIQDARAKNY